MFFSKCWLWKKQKVVSSGNHFQLRDIITCSITFLLKLSQCFKAKRNLILLWAQFWSVSVSLFFFTLFILILFVTLLIHFTIFQIQINWIITVPMKISCNYFCMYSFCSISKTFFLKICFFLYETSPLFTKDDIYQFPLDNSGIHCTKR